MSGAATRAFEPVDRVAVAPASARVYEHGWQSWSPSGVHPATSRSPRPLHDWQHTMRFRPGTELLPEGFQGEGLLAVQPAEGDPVKVYATAPDSPHVASIRARLVGEEIVVEADGPVAPTVEHATLGTALAAFGDDVGRHRGVTVAPAPSVWCTWYQYFLEVTQRDVERNLEALAASAIPVDVVQVDDGWESEIGDWTTLSPRFESLEALARTIRGEGRRAGIWLAPFLVGERSETARRHPGWLVGDAGWNWEQRLVGLDLSHGEVTRHLDRVFTSLREIGFDYFKLDFLYSGALPGRRAQPVTPEEAYATGLQVIRDAVGDAFVVACGAPMLPSVGLVDAMRVSADTYNPDDPDDGDDVLRGRAAVEARAWQHGRWWVNDPDCLVLRPGFAQRGGWADVVERYGGLRSFSDEVDRLDRWGLEAARRLLGQPPPHQPFDELPPGYS